MTIGMSVLTLGRERNTLTAVCHSSDLIHFKPDVARAAGKVVDTVGRLRHVHIYDTRVVNRAVAHDSHLLSCSNIDGRSSAGLLTVIARHVRGINIRDGCLGFVIVGEAYVDPLGSHLAVND